MRAMVAAAVVSLAAFACGANGSTTGDNAAPVEGSVSLVGSWSGSISYERGMFVGETSDAELDIAAHPASGQLAGSVRVDGETHEMSGTVDGTEVVMDWNEAEFAGVLAGSDSIAGEWADLDPDGSGGSFRFTRR